MKRGGATNLWENWDGCDSRCHPMFGAVTEYFFSDILGIRRYHDQPGYRDVVITPANIPALKNVKGEMHTPEGSIFVEISTSPSGERQVKYRADGAVRIHND